MGTTMGVLKLSTWKTIVLMQFEVKGPIFMQCWLATAVDRNYFAEILHLFLFWAGGREVEYNEGSATLSTVGYWRLID